MTLQAALADLADLLADKPGMSGSEVLSRGRELLTWKTSQQLDGIFKTPPTLMTATLDDGIGQGLKSIHCFAELAGMKTVPLGLMQAPETIIAECRRQVPDFLGLTVLHYETEERLCSDIIPQLPDSVQVIAGGPIFATMSEAVLAAKPYRVLNNIKVFLNFLLDMNDNRGL